ncbi:SusD/RagB family nutrient-binding outer membrane lipoprotein [Sunxiuqinia sp. sy24]|uniref:SusD/RagB family nutrient-binding outer membrane lipoprotein n=1 Tax=Sunxiuqinia sp. sy24 TaxID=3461495 RepID=UPI0040467CD1
MKNRIIYFFLLLIAISACRTWDEDFNTNINNPQITESNSIHPSFFVGPMIHASFGFNETVMNVMPPVSEYTGKQRSLSQGNRHRSWHDLDGNIWGPAYSSIRNVKNLRRAAIASEDDRYLAVAEIWESYVMYTICTIDGPVPYFDVIDDSDEVKYLINYDPQENIYPAILEKLKTAGLLIKDSDVNIDQKSDYVYAGDIHKWKKLANTLRFRMAMYMYNAAPETAKSIMQEIVADPNTYPVFESNDDNFAIHYDGVDRISRWYSFGDWQLKENTMSNILIERLISLKDPRLYVYAKPVQKVHDNPEANVLPTNPGPDKYIGHLYGITTGNGDASSWNGGMEYCSRIGDWFITVDENMQATSDCANHPAIYGTYAELLFNMAEAATKGIISGGDAAAKQYYEEGVRASFDMYNCEFSGNPKYDGAYADQGLSSVSEYLAQDHVNWDAGRDHLVLIAEQKWISMLYVGFESYFDHRRTMLPELRASHRSANYESSGSGTQFPSRTAYPDSEEAENTAAYNNARATGFDIPITGDDNRNEARMWLLNNNASPSLEMPTFQEPLKSNEEYPGQANFKAWYDNHWTTMFWWENE